METASRDKQKVGEGWKQDVLQLVGLALLGFVLLVSFEVFWVLGELPASDWVGL